ncbi:uncharacterized protein LOC126575322 [Anopheles aquasalis]|uniref:uncharacterized protein LOC126575322 n=1 Tax=Anopheles aquasalis TaxID=42839 RepID=UPI00215B0549|nr:uncharacterized protein LOC126575322 [Anopheles aquasalis]
MAGIIRSLVSSKSINIFSNSLKTVSSHRYASSNRVKRIKKPEITDRDANQAKSAAMRAENEEQGAIFAGKRFQSVAQSLSTRGYLRAVKPYQPPANVEEQLESIAKASGITDRKGIFSGPEQKFTFLNACCDAFGHSVPNSVLHEVLTVEDALVFYQTPIDTRLPLDAISTMELPENLYIQQDPVRFHPETDTMFGGKSAFPKSSTIVTGIKYKQKYRGHEAKKSWP